LPIGQQRAETQQNKPDPTNIPQAVKSIIQKEKVKVVNIPKGEEAYEFKVTKEYLIGAGAYSNVFRATRKHDK
jgi:hypothetical protein